MPGGDYFPASMLVDDLAAVGVNMIYFIDQSGASQYFLHKTQVEYAAPYERLG